MTVCQRKDGTGLPVLVLPQPFRDDAGDVIGGVSVIVDLSAHRVPQIAESLHISPHAVCNHLKSIFEKVGVSSQAALIRMVHSLAE